MLFLNRGIVAAVTFIILSLTLSPSGGSEAIENAFCILCGERGFADLVLNVVLFIPLGVSLSRLGWRMHRIVMFCVLASASIELLQLALPGRTPSVRDVLTNALGGWLGAVGTARARQWIRPGRAAIIAFIVLVILTVTTVAATGWLLSIAPRGEQPLFGQWAPKFANMAHWAGEVQAVMYNGKPLPSRRLPPTPADLTSAPLSGRVKIDVLVGPRPSSLSPIFAVADISGKHLLLIGQDENDVIIRARRNAASMRLSSPSVRFRGALNGARDGDLLTIDVLGIDTPAPCIVLNERSICSRLPAAGRGWALLIYRDHWPHLATAALDSLMFALLGLPIGFLILSVPRAIAGGGVFALVLLIPVAASISGLARPSFFEAVGLGVGLALGSIVATRF